MMTRLPKPLAFRAAAAHANFSVRPLFLALTVAGMASAAHADGGPSYRLSGFGTVAAVHSNDSGSDFKASVFQPNGAGHTSAWSFNPDTRLGLQADGNLNDTISGVVQVVSQHQYDDTYTPHVEWANIKYQATSELSLRIGRIAAPSFLLSESRFVGYASPWVRPPGEVYSVLPITSNDGVDATYRATFAGANHSFQAYVGRSTVDVAKGSKAKSKLSWGINDSAEFGSFTVRAGYNSFKLDLDVPTVTPLLAGLTGFSAAAASVPLAPYQAVAAQASALARKYAMTDMSLSAIALGASYDPGTWFVMSEFVGFKGAGFLVDSRAWYASSGYRFGAWTPFVAYSTMTAQLYHETIDTTGAAPLAVGAAALTGGLNATQEAFGSTQNTSSIGVRWDAMKNLALKAQYDSVNIGSSSSGRFATFTGVTPSKHPHIISVAADFVF
ncbi:MAG: hypothetical protein M3N82_03730 [Pseudomonadota bacterium]|nr:hypothetical protein [Pseudomonadota bacterium]